jgi:hypothetical protein
VSEFIPDEPGVMRVPVRAPGPELARSIVLRTARDWFGGGFPVAAESCERRGDGMYVVKLRGGDVASDGAGQ